MTIACWMSDNDCEERLDRDEEKPMKAITYPRTTLQGCLPTKFGARVRRAEGKVTVTDGPFAEGKGVVAGLAILKVASKEQAVELAKLFLGHVGPGERELRQLYDTEAGEPACAGKRDRVEAA